MDGGEGDAHGEGGRVGYIEGGEPFCGVDGSGAGDNGPVGGIADLHPLFDDWERGNMSTLVSLLHRDRVNSPSKGFMKASEETVAIPPARATAH